MTQDHKDALIAVAQAAGVKDKEHLHAAAALLAYMGYLMVDVGITTHEMAQFTGTAEADLMGIAAQYEANKNAGD